MPPERGERPTPLGVVLAGGPGSRMGGNKPQRLLGGRRLIDRALEAMAQVCPRQVVVTVDPAVLADAPCTIIRDRWPGQGPMAAFVTAFLDTGAQAILVMAVDLPLVRPKLLELLAFGGEPDDRARTPMGPGGPEPLLAYYHRRALPAAMRLLEKGDKRPRMLLKAVGARCFSPQETAQADPEGLSFFNVNYPEDLQKVHRLGLERGLFDTE